MVRGTIQDYQESMTVFYALSTGVIRFVDGGITGMDRYGPTAEDMKLIQDCIVVPRDRDVMDNHEKYKVDLTTKQVVKVITSQAGNEINDMKGRMSLMEQAVNDMLLGGGGII